MRRRTAGARRRRRRSARRRRRSDDAGATRSARPGASEQGDGRRARRTITPRLSLDDGTSTMTLVALTTHTASWPTTSPSSSTASAVIRLTRRCGPARTSTTAATRSFSIRVTIPENRLRADWATIGRSLDWRSALGQEPGDLLDRHEALAAVGAVHAQAALLLPATERLDGDAEHLGGVAHPDAGVIGSCCSGHTAEVSAFRGIMSMSAVGLCGLSGPATNWRRRIAEARKVAGWARPHLWRMLGGTPRSEGEARNGRLDPLPHGFRRGRSRKPSQPQEWIAP